MIIFVLNSGVHKLLDRVYTVTSGYTSTAQHVFLLVQGYFGQTTPKQFEQVCLEDCVIAIFHKCLVIFLGKEKKPNKQNPRIEETTNPNGKM